MTGLGNCKRGDTEILPLAQDLQRAHDLTISGQIIRNRLHEVQLSSSRPLRVLPLTRSNRAARDI